MVGLVLRPGMKRLQLFPDTTQIENDTLTIDGQGLDSLADEYGTPLYVYDCVTMDNAVTNYKRCLASHYSRSASVTYAGKAYLSTTRPVDTTSQPVGGLHRRG